MTSSIWIGISAILLVCWMLFIISLLIFFFVARHKEIIPNETIKKRRRERSEYDLWMIPEHEIAFERWVHEADAYKQYRVSKSTLDYDQWLSIQIKRNKGFKSKYFI